MAFFDNLKKKYTELLNPVKKSLSDDSGWFRQGNFTPVKQVQSIANNFNPTSNNGNNFWSTPTATKLSSIQMATQPIVQEAGQRLKQGALSLGNLNQNLYAGLNPFQNKQANQLERQKASQYYKSPQAWQDIKSGTKGTLTAYGLANPALAATSALVGGGLNTVVNTAGNILNKQPVSLGAGQSFAQGAGQGLANSGTTRLTNGIVNVLSNKIPALRTLTDKALSEGLPAKTEPFKQAITKWADVAGKKLFRNAIVETAVETPIWAYLNQQEKERFIDAVKREAVENMAMNVAMSGFSSTMDLTPIVSKAVKDSTTKLTDNYIRYASSPEGLKAQAGSVQLPKTGVIPEGKGITAEGKGITAEAQNFLESVKQKYPNINENNVIAQAKKIADNMGDKEIKPNHLAEAFQYREPAVNIVTKDSLMNGGGFTGTEILKRRLEVGASDGVNPHFIKLVDDVKTKIGKLSGDQKSIFSAYMKFYSGEDINYESLSHLNNILDKSNNIKSFIKAIQTDTKKAGETGQIPMATKVSSPPSIPSVKTGGGGEGVKKYKTTVNIQDKNDIEYLRRILSDDQINDIKSGKMTNWRGTPYEDMAKVNIISETPKTIEQQLKGKIKDVQLKSNTFYHGTSAENAKGIMTSGFKRGNELPEDIFRGGGYGKIQNSISFAETPKEASIFSTLTKNGEIVEAKLKPNSKVVSIKGIEDANDLDEFIPYLTKQKVDAVYIGGGEKELVVLNSKAVSPVKSQISPESKPSISTPQNEFKKLGFQTKGDNVVIYRGTGPSSPLEGNYFTGDKEYAREFLGSGRPEELKTVTVPIKDIYKPNVLPESVNEQQMTSAILEAKQKGFKALLVDEGGASTPSVFYIDKVKPDFYNPQSQISPESKPSISTPEVKGVIPEGKGYQWYDNQNKKFVPAEGAKPVPIEGLDTFVHKAPAGGGWVVSEAKSGAAMSEVSKTQQGAIDNATSRLKAFKAAGNDINAQIKKITDSQVTTTPWEPDISPSIPSVKTGGGGVYDDYQAIHKAVKNGEIKIGDTVRSKAYGGETVKIEPVTTVELDALGIPIKYRIKSVTLPKKLGGEGVSTKELGQTPVEESAQLSIKPQAKPKLKVQTPSQPPSKLPPQDIDSSQGNIPQERGFITTAKEAPATAKPVKAEIKGTYTPITNKETVAQAQKIVSKDYDSAKTRVYNEPLTAETNTIAQELVKKAQKEGRYDEAIDIIETMAKKGTESGQAIQAFSIWNRLTPEGMLKFAEREIRKSNETAGTLTKIFKKGDNKLSKDTAKFISEQMARVQKMVDGPQKDAVVKNVLQKINDEIPIGASELFDAYRYQNLLSSPRTQMRNAYQNAYQALVNKPATMAAEAGVDWINSALRGKERATYLKDIPTYYKGLWNSRVDAVNGFMEIWKGKQDFTNLDIKDLRNRNLPKGLTVVSRAMEGADKYFQALIGGGEYAVAKKQGLSDVDAKARAQKAADYYLLRNVPDPKNKTGQGAVLTAIDNATVGVSELGRRIPALRWFVPFVRTPMNAAKQWIEYSPAGILTSIGATNKKTQLAKAMIGSAVVGMGANLALQDRTTWSAPTDKKEKELFYASGKKPYSVRIGDKWVPMVYLGPHALALAIPASVKQYQQDSRTALTDTQIEKLTKSTTALLGFFSEQTFLSGLGNFVRAISGDADYTFASNISGAVGQIIPLSSLSRYVSQIVDPVFRKTGGKTMTDQFVNQLKTQIPFASKTLEPYTLPTGELSKRNLTDYVLPYSLGQEKTEYNPLLKQRQEKLQQNAVINQAKSEAEKGVGSVIGNTIVYTNENGNAATLDLTKYDKIASLPTTNKYETAVRESKQYAEASKIIDNDELSDEQKQIALNRLGISQPDATYYAVANDNNNLKTLYSLDKINDIMNANGSKQQVLDYLTEGRKEINGKMVVANGVLDNLVDEGVITKAEASAIKQIKLDSKGNKISLSKAKKPKKITFKAPKVLKLKAPKITQIKIKSPKIKRVKAYKRPKIRKLKVKRIKLKKFKA